MSKLNLDSFNDILLNALGEDAKKELLEMELNAAYQFKIQAMEALVDTLNKGLPYKGVLKQINNIDSNCDKIGRELAKLGAFEEDKNDE
ncbi:MAG: hypothetical protein Q4C42_11735 [Clostridia bacterium]|nr:hypothetical protein [Clostridia bacterium]